MTYCLGMQLKAGLVMMADTRTNAGVDNFSSFKKLHLLADGLDRQIFACTAGSLSMSQSVISLLQEGLPASDGAELSRSLGEATSMFRAAQLVGEAVQVANETVGAALKRIHLESAVSLLLGGRVRGGPLSLFLVYNAGNFIECTAEVPFLQIGETKYGRPILDRGLDWETPLHEAVKVGLLSFDSTMQSNLGVARPIDLVVMPRAKGTPVISRRIEAGDIYFNDLSERWGRYLGEATRNIPNPPWMRGGEGEKGGEGV
jgi:putative proteasome-type protease